MKTKILTLGIAALQLQAFACGGAYASINKGLVAHEWGTFTSVQGADGAPMRWNPFITTELPSFVHDVNKPFAQTRRAQYGTYVSKAGFAALQRMETPVIYFYSDKEQTVNVRVDFPQGTITEWFPEVADFSYGGRSYLSKPGDPIKSSFLDWQNIHLFARSETAEQVKALPLDKSGSHYFAARDVEANVLSAPQGKDSSKPEVEQFLFYRGIGNFQAPLEVTLNSGGDVLTVRNSGAEELRHLYVLAIQQGEGKFLYVPALGAKATQEIRFNPKKDLLPLAALQGQIAQAMTASLSGEGLYQREAGAMVKTWHDSWFSEPGLRVLYTLPRAWTDRTLPLTITPVPKGLARVMVGRAEMITPEMERNLLRQVTRFNGADEAEKLAAVKETAELGLGRFAEPAMRRVLGPKPSADMSRAGWNLLEAVRKSGGASKPLVSR